MADSKENNTYELLRVKGLRHMVIICTRKTADKYSIYSSKIFLCRMKFQTHWHSVDLMILTLVKEMFNTSLKGWKGNAIYEF